MLLLLVVAMIGHITVSIERFAVKTRSPLGFYRLMQLS